MNARNVTIVSPFRSNASQVDLFATDVDALDYPRDHLRVVAVTGDNVDDTLSKLLYWRHDDHRLRVVEQHTHRKKYPSVVSAERFYHLAEVFNKCLDSVDWEWSDYSLFIPSDTSFVPELVTALVGADKDIISPFFWAGDHANGYRFYDIWGFSRDGQKRFPPYSYAWYQDHFPAEPFACEHVGGAMLCAKRVIEAGCRYTQEDADHGLCETARAKGFEIWAHPGVYIVHR